MDRLAPTDSTVQILGETGTGKERLAHSIYGHSLRKSRPLITTNLATIPTNLIETPLDAAAPGRRCGTA